MCDLNMVSQLIGIFSLFDFIWLSEVTESLYHRLTVGFSSWRRNMQCVHLSPVR